jgi:hypothetical protein
MFARPLLNALKHTVNRRTGMSARSARTFLSPRIAYNVPHRQLAVMPSSKANTTIGGSVANNVQNGQRATPASARRRSVWRDSIAGRKYVPFTYWLRFILHRILAVLRIMNTDARKCVCLHGLCTPLSHRGQLPAAVVAFRYMLLVAECVFSRFPTH